MLQSVDTITFKIIIRYKGALLHLIAAQKEQTIPLTSDIQQKFQELGYFLSDQKINSSAHKEYKNEREDRQPNCVL